MNASLRRIEKLEKNRVSWSEQDRDAFRKKLKRAESARIWIPDCVDPQRRERAIADPELFLKTYFADKYPRPFEKIHREIIEALVEVARYGGKQSVAAPRGFGKSEVVKGMIAYLIFAGLIRFPVPVCQTTEHAEELYEDFRDKVANNDLIYADFPEVSEPVRALNGAPQSAARQHVNGKLTHLVWKQKMLRLPDIPEKHRGPIDYGGVRMEYRGLDAAIRGINRKGDRPDFVPIDDPETRESAKSDAQIRDRIKAVDQDVNGLAGHGKKLAQVMITTIQNNFCLSYKFVHEKPAWLGKCFGWVESWPDEWNTNGQDGEGLWYEYIALRQQDQRNGDRHGSSATKFYLDNCSKLEAGGVLNSEHFETETLPDGTPLLHSAWQVIFNDIADTSFEAFCTEKQNKPPEEEKIETLELSPAKVASALSGIEQSVVPDEATCTTMGIDIGKYVCWFVKISWDSNATGWITDYGQFHTAGLDKQSGDSAVEQAIITALEQFSEQSEESQPPLLTLVDDGYKDNAVNEACRRIEGYFPAKGGGGRNRTFRVPAPSDDKQPFLQAYASRQYDEFRREFWLYNVNTEYWKNWLQERWVLPVWETQNVRTRGSMAVFDPPQGDVKFHTKFAKSQVAERLEHIPLPTKGFKAEWVVKDKYNNHWLDAAALACAAAGCVGIRLVQREAAPPPASKQASVEERASRFTNGGRPFLVTQR